VLRSDFAARTSALDVELTMDDPMVYKRTLKVTFHQTLMVHSDLLEAVCLEDDVGTLSKRKSRQTCVC
jgi:hypothetical protein